MWPHSTRSGVYIVNSRKKREGERGVPYRSGYNIFCRVFITICKLPAFMSSLPLKCCCNSLTLMTCLYIWQLCSAPYRAILILAKPFSVRPATIPLWPTNVFTEIRWLASRRGVADRINDGSARNRSAEVRVLYNRRIRRICQLEGNNGIFMRFFPFRDQLRFARADSERLDREPPLGYVAGNFHHLPLQQKHEKNRRFVRHLREERPLELQPAPVFV